MAAALLLQFSIGAVYAWSIFSKAFVNNFTAHHGFALSKADATLPFEVTIGMIFIGTYVGGRIQDRRGPRVVALAGGLVYGLGTLLASLATTSGDLWLLVLTYGVVGGFGLGVAYIVPIAMLQKWFPDRRALITGIAVGGFGFGAVLTSPVAQRLIDHHPLVPTRAFLPLGTAYLAMALIGASFFRNPPEGYSVPGWTGPTDTAARAGVEDSGRTYTLHESLRTPQWYLLTAILALNVTAGIALISQAAASATDIAGYTKTGAASAVGLFAVFNGGGRILWAAVSDTIGRMPTFLTLLALQGLAFLALPHATSAAAFFVLAALIYLCYGGAFGTMPATAGDFFGVRHAGAIYGLMILGWSLGGVVGPQVAAHIIGNHKNYTGAYTTIGVIALVSMVLPLLTKPPRHRTAGAKPGGGR